MTASRICHDKRETSTALAYFVTEFRNVFPVCHALYYTVALQSTVLGVVEMFVRQSVRHILVLRQWRNVSSGS